MKVIVLGATGRVGPHAVSALRRDGHSVSALARRAAKLDTDRFISTDLADTAAVTAAVRGHDAALLITPNCEEELALAESAIAALEAGRVGRVAYLGINNAEERRSIPHFAYKLAIDRRLQASNLPSLTLGASYFFQNDAAALEVIRKSGIYPSPIGEIGISAVDVRDIADALVHVLFDDRYLGRTIPLIGADVLTGSGAAAIWSEVTGEQIRYGGNDTTGMEAALTGAGYSSWLIDDLCQMMRRNQTEGALAKPGQAEAARKAIGHEPRRYSDFVAGLIRTR